MIVYNSDRLQRKAPDDASTHGAGAAIDDGVVAQQDKAKPGKKMRAKGFLTKGKGAPATVPLSFV